MHATERITIYNAELQQQESDDRARKNLKRGEEEAQRLRDRLATGARYNLGPRPTVADFERHLADCTFTLEELGDIATPCWRASWRSKTSALCAVCTSPASWCSSTPPTPFASASP